MKSIKPRVFILDDDPFYCDVLRTFIETQDYGPVKVFHTGSDCLDHMYQNPEILLLDFRLVGETGLDVLKEVMRINPNVKVILLSSQKDVETAVELLKYGAVDYLEKDDDTLDKLEQVLARLEQLEIHLASENKKKKTKVLVAVAAACVAITAVILFM